MSELRIEKLSMESTDIAQENINKIKELFPQLVTEGKIDFELLKTILGEQIENQNERYQFTWNGKSDTIRFAQKPSTGTLRPDKESSKNWDTTENLYIEGDNLEVLKLLQKTYHNKIKMIYIDPPYNTGGDFVYKDDFKDSIKNYKEQTNQTLRTNPETSGRYHTDWLNMMYSRLMLAKNLLTEDGIIFISIDDNEIDNLKKVANEIFGEQNYLTTITRSTGTPTGGGFDGFVNEVDYILVFSKSINDVLIIGQDFNEEDAKIYNLKDENGCYLIRPLRRTGGEDKREDRPTMFYGIKSPDNTLVFPYGPTGYESRWICSQQKYDELLSSGLIEWKKIVNERGATWQVYQKFYLENRKKKPGNLWSNIEGNKKATRNIKSIFNNVKVFDYPKPTEVIKKILEIGTNSSDLVLDFFSGSSTTADAVMQLNAEDGGNRKFIMVQLPEKTDEKSEAFKAGYSNICEIGKERIRRAGDKIKNELVDKKHKERLLEEVIDPEKLDIGFKVFKLDSSNISAFDSSSKDIDSIFNQDVFVSDRSQLDILYEILLKYGVFDKPVEILNINGKEAFSVAYGHMIVFINHEISENDILKVIELKPREVIIDERGFKTDNDKMNAVIRLEAAGVEKISTI